jgi:antibiotic biosynthesis monooxygenase (ABM) superfamily enzyme
MEYQLRMYRAKPGSLDAFVEEWERVVVPLRRAMGFEVTGAWRGQDGESFVWVVGFDGDFAAADAAYYGSPERAALDPDPARHLAGVETRMLRPL